MDDTDHSISQQPLAGADIQGFDYGGLDAEKAQTLRDAALAIRGIQSDALGSIGRHLLEAKKLLGYGPFLRWAAAELGIKPRSAQNYMAGAQFIEGKCETVAHLPPSIIYKLSSPSAPAAVVAAVVAASETGINLPVEEINERLDAAREEEKEIQQEIARAKTKLTKEEAKDQLAKRKADQAAAAAKHKLQQDARNREEAARNQRREGRTERISRVIENIAKTLTDANLVDLVDMLNDYYASRAVIVGILQAEQNSRIPPPEEKPIVPTVSDPTEWQNKRDYCLLNTTGLTGNQQEFIAALHGNPTPEQLGKLNHIHAIVKRLQQVQP